MCLSWQVFGPRCTQAELYGQAIKPIVTEMLEGFNCTIFAYGQTGTGELMWRSPSLAGRRGPMKGERHATNLANAQLSNIVRDHCICR